MSSYLPSVIRQFRFYKNLAERAISQCSDKQIFEASNENSNCIAIIVQHIAGNMLSRWTDPFETDGEKDWRNRDQEFELLITTKTELMIRWEKAWALFLEFLNNLSPDQLEELVYIRNMGHTLTEAINRQMAHYAYHIGQIVFQAKQFNTLEEWNSLSIPKGQSKVYNANKFKKEKKRQHFTDDKI